MDLFKTLIIDPPWSFREKAGKNFTQSIEEKYPTLSIPELAGLSIDGVMDPDEAYIFLWVPSILLPEAFFLMKHWRFQSKSQLCWVKTSGYGLGFWVRGQHELVMIGKRPKAPSIKTPEVSTFFFAPREGHSEKPTYVHKFAEKYYPGPYLEIFGRKARPNWTVLGNEAPGDGVDIRTSLTQLSGFGYDAVLVQELAEKWPNFKKQILF
jgi:N6-adenosine-specific RNA methylase IME4